MSEPDNQAEAPAPAPPGDDRQPPTRPPSTRNPNGGPRSSTLRNFKGKEPSLPVLGTRKESWSQNTAHYLKELSNHALTTFKHPAPVARGIDELEDPRKYLDDEFPTKARCMENWE